MVNFTKYCTKVVASKISKLRDLVEDEDLIFLGNIKFKIILFHSPTNFGGTRARTTNKVACLLRLGPEATVVLLNEDKICSSKRFKGDTKEKIYNALTKEEINGLGKVKGHALGAIFIPAPFLINVILDINSKEPEDLILEANRIGNVFANQDQSVLNNEAEGHV